MSLTKPIINASDLFREIRQGNRSGLAKAITLVESTKESDRQIAEELLKKLLPFTGTSIRIAVTGVPGAGKSTFIESFGDLLTKHDKKVAVLAIDPSSQLTKGSILGDKTRMEQLSRNPNVFIRPSPTSQALGGVSFHTRETILLCEAAGFNIILIETVGVGQSETNVKSMVDFFLLLLLAGAGDELQGIKKGIMEMADGVVINKADGENIKPSQQAKADVQNALHLQLSSPSGWSAKVLTISALENTGIEEVWKMIHEYQEFTTSNGFFSENRRLQKKEWLEESIESYFRLIKNEPSLTEKKEALIKDVMSDQILPGEAARKYWEKLKERN
ncbi:MAG: methylmalonyl Co-A mutase-associated GTPase MeaB [Cyclobacteriaceae bacterium]|nr:methylmalonyl Co-A mutase-associated GTPase MeaB [Cyclobacteriaceae bacterium]